MGSGSGFRALRHVTGDHRRAQGPLRPIVRGLDARICEAPQQVAPVVMPAQFSEPPLMIPILPAAVAPLIRERLLQGPAVGTSGTGP
jgi:hypothetical protein